MSKQQIQIGIPEKVTGRLLVKIPADSLAPGRPAKDEYREYNVYAGKKYYKKVEVE